MRSTIVYLSVELGDNAQPLLTLWDRPRDNTTPATALINEAGMVTITSHAPVRGALLVGERAQA